MVANGIPCRQWEDARSRNEACERPNLGATAECLIASKQVEANPMATKKLAKRSATARKYSPAAGEDVEREMKAMKQGKLKSGSGQRVTNPKQAIAIGLAEARREGKKVPPPKQR